MHAKGSLSMFSCSDYAVMLNVCCLFFMYCVLIFVYVDVRHGAAVIQVEFQT